MWQAVVRQNPGHRVEYRFIADGLADQHRYDEAFRYAEIAFALPGDEPDARPTLGQTYRAIAVGSLRNTGLWNVCRRRNERLNCCRTTRWRTRRAAGGVENRPVC